MAKTADSSNAPSPIGAGQFGNAIEPVNLNAKQRRAVAEKMATLAQFYEIKAKLARANAATIDAGIIAYPTEW
jgi:hypothetical protein